MFIFMQDKSTPALAAVAPKSVHTLVLAATVLLRALVLICEETDQSLGDLTHTFNTTQFYSFSFGHTIILNQYLRKTGP